MINFLKNRKKRKLVIWLASIILTLAILVGACAIYLSDYYRADLGAIATMSFGEDFEQIELEDESIAFVPTDIKAGFIFYPGGKVEHSAYIPLMRAMAQEGILCIIARMPFNLAVLDIDAAQELRELYPSLNEWYIGGHSLGGSMAASHLEDFFADYKGLVLLGSYSTTDLNGKGLRALSIYGSEDKVMDAESYKSNKSNLPSDLVEIIIDGGNHAYFGVYGKQDGDGGALISNFEQITRTSRSICEFILG